MKLRLGVVVVLAGFFLLLLTSVAQDKSAIPDKKEASGQQKAEVYYSCSMHPEVVADKAGKCPQCGMELTKKNVASTTKGAKMSGKKGAMKNRCGETCGQGCGVK